MKPNFKKYNKSAIMAELNQFDLLAKEHDHIEITAWENGDGFDINICSNNENKIFQLTWGEFDAIKKLIKILNKNDDNK